MAAVYFASTSLSFGGLVGYPHHCCPVFFFGCKVWSLWTMTGMLSFLVRLESCRWRDNCWFSWSMTQGFAYSSNTRGVTFFLDGFWRKGRGLKKLVVFFNFLNTDFLKFCFIYTKFYKTLWCLLVNVDDFFF